MHHYPALTGDLYRSFSCRLADSALLQLFCLIDRIDAIKTPGKLGAMRENTIAYISIWPMSNVQRRMHRWPNATLFMKWCAYSADGINAIG